jgi:hypothetical protein
VLPAPNAAPPPTDPKPPAALNAEASPPVARAVPVVAKTPAKSQMIAMPKALPASGLGAASEAPKRASSTPVAQKTDGLPGGTKPMPKLIF